MEAEGVGDHDVPKLFAAEGVDAEPLVLVSPDVDEAARRLLWVG